MSLNNVLIAAAVSIFVLVVAMVFSRGDWVILTVCTIEN
jgi:hypothetical protein